MKKDLTDIVFLLDRSGSMASTKKDTIGGFNEFLRTQKEVKGKANFTLVQFATHTEHNYTKDIQDVEPLNGETYQSTGSSTAYLDALGKTINSTGERLRSMPESERPEKVVFVVFTDGWENASREFSRIAVKDMIKHQEDKYNWQFVFMGANMDAVAEGASLGVQASNAFTYKQNAKGISRSYLAVASNLGTYRSGHVESMAFTKEQREEQEQEEEEEEVK